MFSKIALLLSLFGICTSCNPDLDSNTLSTAQERSLAENLPLRERYELYEKVYDRTRPPDLGLVNEVVKLGRPALEMAIRKAKNGNAMQITAAIEILEASVINESSKCSSQDLIDMKKNIQNKFHKPNTAQIVEHRVVSACHYDGRNYGNRNT